MSLSVFDRFCLRLGRAGVVLAVILAPLCLAEAAARLLHDPPPVRRVYDPFAYRISQPLLVDEFTNPDGERITVRLNELGMRGPSISEPLAPGTLTLVFLGGSTTENYAFHRPDTFPELIGERIGARLGRPVRVMNAGMSAATTGVSMGRLQHQVLDLEPSLIVVMHGINDLFSGLHPGFRRDGRHLPRPPTAGRRPRSYLWDWIRRWPERPFRRTSGPRAQIDDFEDYPALEVFARNLRSMAAIATAHGIPILFLTQATMYREEPLPGDEEHLHRARYRLGGVAAPPDIASFARGMRAFNEVTLTWPLAASGHTFDLAARIPQSFDVIFDDCHYTLAGNRRVAAELSPPIEQILRPAAAAEGG